MAEIIVNAHAQESGHWYTKDGKEAHSYLNKKGEEKPTTLRQARTEGLVPSVTSIIRLASAPGLDAWKADQLIMACLTLPRIQNENEQEPEADYIARIKADAKEQAKKAAEKGTEIHALVQRGFENTVFSDDKYYISALNTIHAALGRSLFDCEKSFARGGYGGKVDLSTDGIVIDIKTTSKPLSDKTWPEHSWQLAAYRHGLGIADARCFILYIHTETAESKLIEIPSKELETGWKCFGALLDFFYAKTGLGG